LNFLTLKLYSHNYEFGTTLLYSRNSGGNCSYYFNMIPGIQVRNKHLQNKNETYLEMSKFRADFIDYVNNAIDIINSKDRSQFQKSIAFMDEADKQPPD
jgi:hypothetical protein